VTVVVYACARCPFCAEIIPRIYDVVLNGSLKGKVKLYDKPYPITTHPNSKEGGLALIAAHKLNKFWPYLMRIYEKFKDFSPEKYVLWATEVGLDGAAFESLMRGEDAVRLLSASKKEGIVNGVESTPTFFIDGRKYGGDLDVDTLVDVMEEEYERLVNMAP
jgi:protein-disulfide isomerase